MRFSCLQENLAIGVATVARLAVRATHLPVLSNVLLKIEDKALNLMATNLEMGLQYAVRGKVEEDGESLVPARLLLELVPLLPAGPLTITTNEQGILIRTKKETTVLRTSPAVDFPIIPTIDQPISTTELPLMQFKTAIAQVSIATGKIEQRPELNGLYLQLDGKNVTVTATDGYRLAEASLTLTQKAARQLKIIIPSEAADEVERVLAAAEGEPGATLTTTESQICLMAGSSRLTSRVINGDYPDYLPLFPSQSATTCRFDRSEFTRTVKAALLFSRAGASDIKLATGVNELIVSAESSDVGTFRTTVPAAVNGPALDLALNARYLLDGLNVAGGAEAILTFTASDRPVLLTPAVVGDVSLRYLIMPIRQ